MFNSSVDSPEQAPKYVITCGDEGVQINEGRRLSFVGAGFRLDGFSEVVKILKKIFDSKLRIVANQENDWVKEKLELNDWAQVDAMAKQHTQALADREKLLYAGFLPFSDPKKLKHEIKGHMVRPKKVHVANKICFTLAGGEQVYNLGCYQISADWLSQAPKKLAEAVIRTQVEFYQKIAKIDLAFVLEEQGVLGEKVAAKNRKVLEKIGFKFA
ncbi:MAG: hypothetical protein PVJ09_02590 [Candidatus Woesebacteria bacterium]|jgi:hypothetical protein